MNPSGWLLAALILKTALDLVIALGFFACAKPAAGLMFAGFTVADLGALWMAL